MSFSGMVKDQHGKTLPDCRNCSIAQCLWQNDCRRDTAVSDRK